MPDLNEAATAEKATNVVRAWRITHHSYRAEAEAFGGFSSARYPGTWNKRGERVVYCSSSIALCALEILVHLKSPRTLEEVFVTFELTIPSQTIFVAKPPENLRDRNQTREIGHRWIEEAKFAVMQVPSIITGEPNYVLNPLHSDFLKLKIDPAKAFKFDPRLRKGAQK